SPADDRLEGRLPVVPVTDLVVRDNDLVISTQGRAFWILDDVSPLRQLAASDEVRLYKPAAAYRFLGGSGARPGLGQNPPSGVVFYYTLPAEPKDKEEVTLELLDSAGKVLRKLSSKEERPA